MFFELFLFTVSFIFSGSCISLTSNQKNCTLVQNCPHISKLLQTKQDSYSVTILMNLVHCYHKNFKIYIKCIDAKIVDKFLEKADTIPNHDSCGLDTIKGKISGGENTEIDEFPWIALLKYQLNQPSANNFLCHGNLINRRYVLTVAHCVDENILSQKKITLVSVILGEYDISKKRDCIANDCADEIKEISVENVHLHPNYSSSSYVNDIALIRMKNEVEYSDFIKPICLPPINLIDPVNESLWIAGWGSKDFNEPNPIKVKATFVIKDQKFCESNATMNPNQFCVKSTSKAKTCMGDSGGPLMLRRELSGTGRLFLIGVDSLGTICSQYQSYSIAIYTKITPYLPWLLTTIDK